MAHNRISGIVIISLGVYIGLTISDGSVWQNGSPETCSQNYLLKTAFCSRLNLQSVPTDLPPNIERLYLEMNLLTVLRNDSFSRYPELRRLTLGDNNISSIESGTFSTLKYLKRLFLTNNPFLPNIEGDMLKYQSLIIFNGNEANLEVFSGDVISWFAEGAQLHLSDNNLHDINWPAKKEFYSVSLSQNKFQEISKNTFVINSFVYNLHLSNNPLKVIDSTTIALLRVDKIYIGGCNLNETQIINLLVGVKKSRYIKSFSFVNAGLQTVPLGIFRDLEGKCLDELDLSSNKLWELSHDGFSGLSGVSRLVLEDNNLQSIEPRQFDGMTALRVLILESNQIVTINRNDTPWNQSITEMDLSRNELVEIGPFTLRGLKTLETLILSGNTKMHTILQGTFAECSSLKELDLSRSGINNFVSEFHIPFLTTLKLESTHFPTALIQPGHLGDGTPSLERLDLQDTSIGREFMWNPEKGSSSFDGLHQLLILDLSQNLFSDNLPVGVFQNLTSLYILRLDECSINVIEVGLFSDLENLNILSLENNALTMLPSGLFDQVKNLKKLFLADNHLTSFSSDLFKYTSNLLDLQVQGNSISSLSFRTFQPIYSILGELDLARNPLVCNCDLQWLPKWLDTSVKLKSSDETFCVDGSGTLEPFRGKQLVTFDPSDECGPNIILYSCLVLVGVAMILTLGLVYYQRWWIRYRLFLLKLCFIGYDEIRDDVDRRNFMDDIAIMLHEVDNEWVNQQLRPALAEKLPDYDRIVCGDDQLMLGMYYLDAINYAVENSFKTIFVISRAALQDQWYMMKFRTALDHVNDVGIEKMVLLFVEDIADDELPFLIRLFLSDHRPYLVWPDNDRGQDYFWEELIKDLTVNIRCNHLVPPDN